MVLPPFFEGCALAGKAAGPSGRVSGRRASRVPNIPFGPKAQSFIQRRAQPWSIGPNPIRMSGRRPSRSSEETWLWFVHDAALWICLQGIDGAWA